MYNDYGINSYTTAGSSTISSGIDSTWVIVSIVLALVGGILIYFLFAAKKNDGQYTGFVAKLHDMFNFKTMFSETILKVLYIITAIFITLSSFAFITTSFLTFVLTLILGNVIARIIYEYMLITLIICHNTTEINKKMKEPVTTKKTK